MTKEMLFAKRILGLYSVNKFRGNEVCDCGLIPDYFDVKATSKTASVIEDIINTMLKGDCL
jgi:hypothetical protein